MRWRRALRRAAAAMHRVVVQVEALSTAHGVAGSAGDAALTLLADRAAVVRHGTGVAALTAVRDVGAEIHARARTRNRSRRAERDALAVGAGLGRTALRAAATAVVRIGVRVDASVAALRETRLAGEATGTVAARGHAERGHVARLAAGAAVERVVVRVDARAAARRVAAVAGDLASAPHARRFTVGDLRADVVARAAVVAIGCERHAGAAALGGARGTATHAGPGRAHVTRVASRTARTAVRGIVHQVHARATAIHEAFVAGVDAHAADTAGAGVGSVRADLAAAAAVRQVRVEVGADCSAAIEAFLTYEVARAAHANCLRRWPCGARASATTAVRFVRLQVDAVACALDGVVLTRHRRRDLRVAGIDRRVHHRRVQPGVGSAGGSSVGRFCVGKIVAGIGEAVQGEIRSHAQVLFVAREPRQALTGR